MIDLKIHHIGYLVKNLEKAKIHFIEMGYALEQDSIYDEYRDVDICFLIKENYRIELVSPKTNKSVVWNLSKKIGNSPYHICYEVQNIDQAIFELVSNQFVIWEKPHVAPAISGRLVVFLFNGKLGMIELLE